MVRFLKESTNIQFDATFKAVPRLFYQLFTIFDSINHHALPALHILMTNKSEKLYSAVVLTIWQLLPSLNPTFAIADFEIAPRNSFTQVFPSITIVGCWFHYTKVIHDNVKKNSLSKLYKNQIFGYEFAISWDYLCFLKKKYSLFSVFGDTFVRIIKF